MGDPAAEPKGSIRLEVADAIATITLDRPDALNALTVAMKKELLGALRAIGRDRAVRSVVLTGAGRAFCAGQDLHLGRKTGRGFYRYDERGRAIDPTAGRPPAAGRERADAAAIVGRIRAAIEDDAALAVSDGVASAADIALALRLGAGHPTTFTDAIDGGERPASA